MRALKHQSFKEAEKNLISSTLCSSVFFFYFRFDIFFALFSNIPTGEITLGLEQIFSPLFSKRASTYGKKRKTWKSDIFCFTWISVRKSGHNISQSMAIIRVKGSRQPG